MLTILKWIIYIIFWPISLPIWIFRKVSSKKIVKRNDKFMQKALMIQEGMPQYRVLDIMGCASNSREVDGNKVVLAWELNQQIKQSGNFIKRGIKVTFVNDIVTSIVRENFDIDPNKM